MTKSQILILLLIIALAFYLTEDKPQPPIKPNFKKPLLKNIKNTKSAEPKSSIEVPSEPSEVKWPSDFPIIELPSARIEPANFGLNPPHSELNNPQANEKTLNCPAPEFIPNPQFSKPSSTLTPEEQLQRKTQAFSDYNWLLNNRTIDYWHYQKQLTNSQYQALLSLVSQEEMNTLEHFLNLLPANHEWLLLSPEFKNQTLINKWKPHFTYQQTNDWLKIGLKPTDYALAAWLKNTKKLTAEEVLNFGDFEQLKAEFTN